MTQHRYFLADPVTYEHVRIALNQAWGLPDTKGTQTCFRPADTAPRNAEGFVAVAVLPEWCDWEPVSSMLPSLVSTGAVLEITQQDYVDCITP